MAHSNIDKRRAAVKLALRRDKRLSSETFDELARQFQYSPSAIRADMLSLTRAAKLATPHVTPRKRAIVHWRDLGVCQYCLDGQPAGEFIIEHVIPASLNGVAELHNLTLACQSCNVAKSDDVWIPNNLFAIAACHTEFCASVLQLAVRNPTNISLDTGAHTDLARLVQFRTALAEERWRTDRPKNGWDRIASTPAFAQTAQDIWHNI